MRFRNLYSEHTWRVAFWLILVAAVAVAAVHAVIS
jgi:hypothetical protein